MSDVFSVATIAFCLSFSCSDSFDSDSSAWIGTDAFAGDAADASCVAGETDGKVDASHSLRSV